MSAVAEEKKIVVGGSFLIEERAPEEVFTVEDFTEEHRMIADTARQFMDNEVRPRIDDLEKKDWKLARELVQKGAELGFIGATVPEEYGGLGLDQVSSAILGEYLRRSASFATTMGAQGGIGLLPILYYGTEEAKRKYIPRIVTGELITAYALTEAGSGSDALAAKATARLSEDGATYVLKGEKMWITNGGFADVFVVFAEVAIRAWVGEAMVYRTLGLIEGAIHATSDASDPESKLRAIEEYAAECSAIKVSLSEYCDFVSDEMVQIYGGYGYSADYPAERAYRDSRINRIFEGTNEINRMLIPGRLMKSALSGNLALLPAAQALMDEVLSPQMGGFDDDDSLLAAEEKLTTNAKKVALMTLGTAAQKYMMKLGDQQEILMGIADIIMDTYAMETAILRARKLAASEGENAAARYLDMTRVFCNDAVERIEAKAKNTLAGMAEGDELRTLLAALRRVPKIEPAKTNVARTRHADGVVAA